MKVLHLLNTIDPAFGGPVEAARQFAIGMPDGVTAEVLTLDPDVSAWTAQWPVSLHTVGPSFTKYRYSPGLVPWLRQNGPEYDAVLVHGVWHYHAVGARLGLRNSGTPYFVIPHGMLHRWFKQIHPLKHIKKALFWHTIVHKAVQEAAAVFFLCEEERRIAASTFSMRLQADAVVPLGIQIPPGDETSARDQLESQQPGLRGKRLLLFFGRICHMKGCDVLLRSFADLCDAHPDVHLLMCGPDVEAWQASLIRMADLLGIGQRVTWHGPVYGAQKWNVFRAAELFVLPSHCETFPVSVLEALACRTPVLLSDQVGIYRKIEQAGAGLVCEDEQQSLTKALRRWLDLGADKRSTARQAAYRCFLDNFEVRSAIQRQLKAIRQFSKQHRTSGLLPQLRTPAPVVDADD